MDIRFLRVFGKCSSSCKLLGNASILAVSVMLLLLFSTTSALAWPVEDLKILPGEDLCVNSGPITIEGMVGPGDYVTITTIYVVEVPVSKGKFEYKQDKVPIPPGTTASITAEGVKDLTVSSNLFGIVDLSKTFDASSAYKVSVSARVPKGNYNLVVSGNAAGAGVVTNCDDGTEPDETTDHVKNVKLTFVATLDVKADKNGYFKQVCCTERPAGEYVLKVGDKTRVVTLRDCSKDEQEITDDGSDGGDVVTENTIAKSGGTGEAKILSLENVSSENATVLQTIPEANAEIVSAEGANEQPVIKSNSIMDYIWKILNWLGF